MLGETLNKCFLVPWAVIEHKELRDMSFQTSTLVRVEKAIYIIISCYISSVYVAQSDYPSRDIICKCVLKKLEMAPDVS